MKTTFLGQGFDIETDKAVGTYLLNFLQNADFHTFTGMSAFASEAGIFGLGTYIKTAKEKFKNITLIVGVDQEGTSREALEEIAALDINGYIFYQEESPIFHPKIYLFEGNDNIALIVGSSNLTRTGLFTNIESSILVEFDISDDEGIRLLKEFKEYYSSLFNLSDPNLFRIDNDIIDLLVERNIVPDEATRRANYNKKRVEPDQELLREDRISPKRATAKVPAHFVSKRKSTKVKIKQTSNENIIDNNSGISIEGKFLWRSGALTARDLNIPKGDNTNPTGSMLFKKGELRDIDQRHYFRETAFASLPWGSDIKKPHLERATAFFKIVIDGVLVGKFPLILTHNTKTDTKTYIQNNSTTQVSWGVAKNFIAKPELINKVATLYNDEAETNSFILTIE